MQSSPQKTNFPKAAYSSPVKVLSSKGGGSPGSPQKSGGKGTGKGKQAANPSSAPTHSAFTQASPNFALARGYGGPQSPQAMQIGQAESARPLRPGALYGALEALQAATAMLRDNNDSAMNAGRLDGMDFTGGRRGPGAANLTPEQVWQSIPSGGEASWKSTNVRQSQRLRVARLQEALSEAAAGLQRAGEAVKGGEDAALLGAASLGPPGLPAALRDECALLEAEAKELEEEKEFLDGRVVEVKQEIERMRESMKPAPLSPINPEPEAPPETPSGKQGLPGDANELAVVLRLLACLKDVALNNRSVCLPTDPKKRTREQQVVAYFLDEVEAASQK